MRDADAAVGHLNLHEIGCRRGQAQRHRHRPLIGEFDRVANKVQHDLPQLALVPQNQSIGQSIGQAIGQGRGKFQFQPLVARSGPKDAQRPFDAQARRKRQCLQRGFAGLQLGKVKNVVDNAQQCLARFQNGIDIGGLDFGQAGL